MHNVLLSSSGIGPTESKVEAVLNAREPETVAEVRRFMGHEFQREIHTTVEEPLQHLTQKTALHSNGRKTSKKHSML